MKRIIPVLFLLLNNEIISCIVLIVYAVMFVCFILNAAAERG